MAPIQNELPARETTRRSAWRRLLPVLAVVAAAWFGVGWLNRNEHRPQLYEGTVPALQLQTFDGTTIDLAALRGQGVVINFWASWCEPCRVEAELFEEAWRAEKNAAEIEEGIVFIGVNRQDTRQAALAFINEFGVSYPNGADEGSVWSQTFGIVGLPSTFFIDANGQIQAVVWGPITTAQELAQQLEKIRP